MENNNTYLEDFTLSKKISDKYYYLFGFIIGLLFIEVAAVFFMGPIISKIGLSNANSTEINMAIYEYQGFIASVTEIIGIALIAIFFRKVIVDDFKSLKDNWLTTLIIIVLGCGLIFGMNYLFNFIYTKMNITESSENQEAIIFALTGKGKWMMILDVAILAPIFEEFVFRKFLFGYLNKTKIPKIASILIVGLVFSLIHCLTEDFTNPVTYLYLANYFSLTIVLIFGYLTSNSNVYASIAIHMFNNILSVVAYLGVINVFFR